MLKVQYTWQKKIIFWHPGNFFKSAIIVWFLVVSLVDPTAQQFQGEKERVHLVLGSKRTSFSEAFGGGVLNWKGGEGLFEGGV
jgi:hypothetical protein